MRADMKGTLEAVRAFHGAATTQGTIHAIYATHNKAKQRVPKSFALDMDMGHASLSMATAFWDSREPHAPRRA